MPVIDEVRELYRVEPAAFVAERAALVKALRAAGRTDDARVVVKVRKPTVAAWALDQVAHDSPELIRAALDAGDALRVATDATFQGDASSLRAAAEADQRAAAAVVDAAGRHLPALTAELRERMAATLRTAVIDDEVRAALVDGVVALDHEPPQLGFGAPSSGPPAEASTAPAARSRRAKEAELAEPPRARRKARIVGSPSRGRDGTARPPDEVDARRRAKAAAASSAALAAEAAERKRQQEAERARQRERKRQQAALDKAVAKARAQADELEATAARAAELAARARADADAAMAGAADARRAAEAAEAAAAAGPPE